MLSALRGRLVAVGDALSLYGNATAAVAVLLRGRDALEVLLTKRAERGDDPWSAQWSFPGGHRRTGEALVDAAVRETEEEVGLVPQRSRLLGCLAARSPANRPEMIVLPFVFRWDGAEDPRPGREVSVADWIPLDRLAATRGPATLQVRGHVLEMPAFHYDGRVIWGFTYRALEDLLKLLD